MDILKYFFDDEMLFYIKLQLIHLIDAFFYYLPEFLNWFVVFFIISIFLFIKTSPYNLIVIKKKALQANNILLLTIFIWFFLYLIYGPALRHPTHYWSYDGILIAKPQPTFWYNLLSWQEPVFKTFSLFINTDHFTFVFVFLTVLIFPLCIIFSSTKMFNYKKFIFYLLILEIILVLSFITADLFLFYVLFESSLILMFLIIGNWGSRSRKIKAAYYFFFYTLVGSIFMFIALFLIYYTTQTFNIHSLINKQTQSIYLELTIWICLFIPFAIKIPMFPFHLWLLEAHVEAPTIGSVILASLLLKLGTYAILRFLLPVFLTANIYFQPLILTLSIFSIFIASFAALRQIDLKRIIAYSSIAHMNVALFGLYSFTLNGLKGSIFLMVGHGFISAALFFLIGILYDRTHTRILNYLTGFCSVMPIYSTLFFLFTFLNLSFPGTVNFISELFIFSSMVSTNKIIAIILVFSTFFVVLFSIISFNRLMFGNISRDIEFLFHKDIIAREFYPLLILFFFSLFFGIFPGSLLQFIDIPCRIILSFYL